jgi:outer membrane protein assembly factor BamB
MNRRSFTVIALVVIAIFAGAARAAEVPDTKSFKGGLIVHIGCGDGKLTAAMGAGDRRLVHGLDTNAVNVAKARQTVMDAGLYGKVTIDLLAGDKLPYIDNLVNCIIADELGKIPMDEVMRVLSPYGTAWIGGRKTVKPWPEDMDEWNHWLHGPDNNAVSTDTRVGISRKLQWTMPPAWGRHHNLLPSLCAMVSSKGRIFCIIDEAPIAVKGSVARWALVARDAFNGLVLWRKPIPNWGWKKWSAIQVGGTMRFKGPDQLFRRIVAVGDRVFYTPGFNEPVVAVDGSTGKLIREYKGTENAAEILVSGKRMFLARNVYGDKPGKEILTVNSDTGEILWIAKGYRGITSRGDELKKFTDAYLTVGKKNAFFLNEEQIVAIDIKTGKEAWRCHRPEMKKGLLGHYDFEFKNLCSLVYHDNILFLGQIDPKKTNLNGWQQKSMELRAHDASSGKLLWRHAGGTLAHFTPPDLFVNKGLVWTMKISSVALVGLDIRTGKVKKEYPVRDMLVGHHHRCYRNKATSKFYLAGEEGIEYINFNSGKLDVHHWIRGACAYGLMPANGLIYMPTHACGCHTNQLINGFFAMASGKTDIPTAAKKLKKLQKGPAFGTKGTEAAGVSDWPVFKHDSMRSNHVDTDIPSGLKVQWKKSIGGKLAPPIIADGKVFIQAKDTCILYCLDATSGEVKWKFITDGPVDSPPSFDKGRLFFGTSAGTVCGLTADDGKLIWRFQAAPADVRLMAFDRLESPWPVNGSVLIVDNKVYCLAGRSMHLDSGLYLSVLDADSGKVLQGAHLQPDTNVKGELKGAMLPDILVSDGKMIQMRSMMFSADDLSQRGTLKTVVGVRPNGGGLLDESWINNTFWKYGTAQGQMLVFDDKIACGIKAFRKLISKSYGQDIFTPGKDGYTLFAVDLARSKPKPPTAGKGKGKKRRGPRVKNRWEIKIPVRAAAMLLAGESLVIAGAPDVVDKKDPWGAFEDRKGGVLQVYSKQTGKKTAEVKLDSAPVYDGLAAAGGKIFITLQNGSVVSLK